MLQIFRKAWLKLVGAIEWVIALICLFYIAWDQSRRPYLPKD